jgi:amino acid transporter
MNPSTTAPADAAPALRRALGLRDVILYFVTAGTNLQWVATAAAAGASSLVVWVIGGLLMFVPLSVCVVFLSSRYPEEGGMYVWSKRAFGPFAGFMTGWTYWTSNLPYFPGLLYFAAGNALFLTGDGSAQALAGAPAYFVTFALLGLVLATWLNIVGLDIAKWLSNVGAYARSAATILLIALGLVTWSRFGSATSIDTASLMPSFGVAQLVFWSTIAFAWTGPESAAFMSGEIHDPQRTLPRALAAAAPMIAAIYILGTLSVLVAVPHTETSALYGVMEAVERSEQRLGLTGVVPVAAILVAVASLGSVGAWLGSVARIPFVAGIDHYLPASFGRLHPRWRTPIAALMTQSTIAALFVFLGQAGTTVKGAYDVLVSMMVIAVLVPFLLLFSAAIKLSAAPPREGEIRVPGGRATIVAMGMTGLATTIGSIFLAMLPPAGEPHQALAVLKIVGLTSVMIGAGVAVYFLGSRRARQSIDAGGR